MALHAQQHTHTNPRTDTRPWHITSGPQHPEYLDVLHLCRPIFILRFHFPFCLHFGNLEKTARRASSRAVGFAGVLRGPSCPVPKHPETHPSRSFFSILRMTATSSQVPEGEDLLSSRPQRGRSVCPMRSTCTKQPEPLVCHKVLALPGRGPGRGR